MPHHIAIVEDEAALAANNRDALQRHQYTVSLHSDRPGALLAFERQMPDLAIIDITLGDEIEGGFELCRELRSRWGELPIVFLTARESELDIVSGLRLGADDYFTKDISLNEMLARIGALLRRVQAMRSPEGLDRVARYASGIGPWVPHVVTAQADGSITATALTSQAQQRGLQVHPYTLRQDELPANVKHLDELHRALFEAAGVDGVFTDFPDLTRRYLDARRAAP